MDLFEATVPVMKSRMLKQEKQLSSGSMLNKGDVAALLKCDGKGGSSFL